MTDKKSVLIAGGAGFIGSHFCDLLINKGFAVVCVDNLISGNKNNIKHLVGLNSFKFVNADISKNLDQVSENPIDYIFHFASPASPIDYWNNPGETLLANSVGTLNLLKLAVNKKAAILIASTSEIYGDPLVHPQKETYFGNVNTFGPRSCYDESKRFAEAATYVYINKYKLDARIIRIFNTYGPRMKKDDGRVVSNFIIQALKNMPITIDGNGSQTRSFCYVTDLIGGIYKAMFTKNTGGEIFNLGNPREFTILELAEKVIKLTKSESKIIFSGNFRKDDPMRRKPDITKAKTYLNWEPKVFLTEGLKKTIEYYRSME